jgi:hypothetical protein
MPPVAQRTGIAEGTTSIQDVRTPGIRPAATHSVRFTTIAPLDYRPSGADDAISMRLTRAW